MPGPRLGAAGPRPQQRRAPGCPAHGARLRPTDGSRAARLSPGRQQNTQLGREMRKESASNRLQQANRAPWDGAEPLPPLSGTTSFATPRGFVCGAAVGDLGRALRFRHCLSKRGQTRCLDCSAEESCALHHIWFKTVILVKESNDWSVVRYPVFIL